MTPNEVIKKVNEIKPSTLDNSALLAFLNSLEAKLRLITNNQMEYEPVKYSDLDSFELLLGSEHDDIYVYYVCAQVDLFSNDIDSYNNYMQMYNQAMVEYTRQYIYRRPKEESPIYQYDYERAW